MVEQLDCGCRWILSSYLMIEFDEADHASAVTAAAAQVQIQMTVFPLMTAGGASSATSA